MEIKVSCNLYSMCSCIKDVKYYDNVKNYMEIFEFSDIFWYIMEICYFWILF